MAAGWRRGEAVAVLIGARSLFPQGCAGESVLGSALGTLDSREGVTLFLRDAGRLSGDAGSESVTTVFEDVAVNVGVSVGCGCAARACPSMRAIGGGALSAVAGEVVEDTAATTG